MKIGFVDSTDAPKPHPIGWDIISYFQQSNIVHVFVVIGDEVYETTETFFHKTSLSSRMDGSKVRMFDVVGLPEGGESAAREYAKTLIGVPYDYTGVSFLGIMLLAEKLCNFLAYPVRYLVAKANNKPTEWMRLVFINNPYHIGKALFCSEAVYHILKNAGVAMPPWWFGENVMPYQVFRFCLDRTDLFREVGR